MVEDRHRQDSSRDLLEELEDGWATPPPPQAGTAPLAARPKTEPTPSSAQSSGDADSEPDVDDLDQGWLDDLFQDEEEEEEEEEEPEPELPDERADPVAFAAAKKAKEERAVLRREKKRVKLEAKRARQKARVLAMRQKQKAKKSRPSQATPTPPKSKRGATPPSTSSAKKKKKDEITKAKTPALSDEEESDVNSAADAVDDQELADEIEKLGLPTKKLARGKSGKTKSALDGKPSTIASIKLLAVVLVALLAIAAAVAAIMK